MHLQPIANDLLSANALLIRDAARIAGCSTSHIRECRYFRLIEPTEIGGRQAVTAVSLFAFMQQRQRRTRPKLRLVVDNT